MFILFKNDSDTYCEISKPMCVFENRDDAEKACDYLNRDNTDKYIDYSVVVCSKCNCFEDFWVAYMQTKFEEKVKEMEDVNAWQAKIKLWEDKYNEKVKEVKELRKLTDKYREEINTLSCIINQRGFRNGEW